MIDLRHLPNAIPDEKVVHVLRRHPITLFSLFLGMAFLLVAPVAVWFILSYAQPELLSDPVFFTLLLMGGSAFFLYAWLFLFQGFMDYSLDIWIVTTKRVLNIEQTGLFARTVSELRLNRIQDVTSTVNGFLHTLFDYGDMEIQTAGEKVRFVFEEIPHPTRVSKSVLELTEINRRESLGEAVEEFGVSNQSYREVRK